MAKLKVKIVVNFLMLFALLILIISGFMMSPLSFRLGFQFRGPGIVTLHDYSSILFTVLVIIHIYLNLPWFKAVLFKKK